MRVENLHISNILSIKEAVFTFKDKGLILVEGWNYDDNRGNGSGKSAIFNALSFGLYDKVPRDVTKKELLRHSAKNGHVRCEVDVGGDIFCVQRTRPSGCSYTKNGKAWTGSQSEFEQKLGLSYEQFLTTMYTSQDSDKRFITLNDRKKKDFILEVLDLKNFDRYAKEAKDQIKVIDACINIKKVEQSGLESNRSVLESVSEDEDYLRKLIANNIAIIDASKEQLIKCKVVSRPDLSKYEVLETKVSDKEVEFKEVINEIEKTSMHLSTLSSRITPFRVRSPDANCPHCEADVNIAGATLIKAADQDEMRKFHDKKIDGVRNEIRTVEGNIKSLRSKLIDIPKVKALKQKILVQKRRDERSYLSAITSISNLESAIKTKTHENKDLIYKVATANANKKKLDDTVSAISKIQAELEIYNSNIDILTLTANIFSPTGAPAYIMDSIVDSFNESVEKYIGLVWPNATYTLQTHKINSDKKVTAKFSESLIMGSKEVSIGSLSGGELKSLSLVLDFAIIDVLSKQYGTSINPIILDEPFNGLDSIGKEIVIELLDKLSRDRQIWVIDHACTAKVLFSDVIRIEKRKGISQVVI